jgi:hypothetical protein
MRFRDASRNIFKLARFQLEWCHLLSHSHLSHSHSLLSHHSHSLLSHSHQVETTLQVPLARRGSTKRRRGTAKRMGKRRSKPSLTAS